VVGVLGIKLVHGWFLNDAKPISCSNSKGIAISATIYGIFRIIYQPLKCNVSSIVERLFLADSGTDSPLIPGDTRAGFLQQLAI
jgi:hypothetical protein